MVGWVAQTSIPSTSRQLGESPGLAGQAVSSQLRTLGSVRYSASNTVPHAVPSTIVILLLLHNCNFATVMNRNVNS